MAFAQSSAIEHSCCTLLLSVAIATGCGVHTSNRSTYGVFSSPSLVIQLSIGPGLIDPRPDRRAGACLN